MRTQSIFPRAGRQHYFDALRAVAALAVAASHIRALFLVDLGDLPKSGIGVQGFYAITGLGHYAVIVFFVLSGCLVGGAIVRSREDWSWRKYCFDRLSRLYVVLIPALVLTALWDYAGLHYSPNQFWYTQPVKNLFQIPVISLSTLPTFLANSTFCQGIVAPPFGSNGPLWSLAYEGWYYLIFPLLFCSFFKPGVSFTARACMAVAGAAALCWVGPQIASGFLIWLSGIIVVFLPPITLVWRAFLLLLAAVGSLAAVGLGRSGILTGSAAEIAFVASIIALLWGLRDLRPAPRGPLSPLVTVSRYSYTLYLVHMPLLLFIRSWVGGSKWLPSGGPLVVFALLAVLVLVYARLIAVITEDKTAAIRSYVAAMIGLNSRGTYNAAVRIRELGTHV